MDMLEQTHQEAMQFTACLLHSEGRPDDDGTTDTGTTNTSNHLEKDSGVGRATDESTRHDESSDHEILVDDASINQKFPVDTTSLGSGGDLRYSNDSFTSNSTAEHDFMGHEISVEECMKFQAALESKCDNKHLRSDTDESIRGKETKVMKLGSDSMDTTSQSGDSLNRPCRNRLICDQQDELQKERRVNGHGDVWLSNQSHDEQLDTIPCQCPSSESSQKVDKPEKDNSHQQQKDLSPETKEEANKENGLPSSERQHRRSGSGSGRSHRAPRTVPGSPGGRSKSSSSSRDRSKSTSSSGSTKGSSKDKHSSPSKGASTNNGESNHKHQQTQQQQQQQDNLGQLPGAKAYPRRPATNPHLRAQFTQRSPYFMQHDSTRTNLLKHNWKVQQQASQLKRSFDKYGSIQSLQSVPGYAKHYRSYLHLINQNEENAMKSQNNSQRNVEGQWKVKIRSDGTRYITKRSSRDRLLKERATKIQEERAGMTTDDEAVSEMKLGRYWSKEDRKRHLERARDQRMRREYMQQARMECLQELEEDGILSGGGGKREPDIVELSHRKLNKKKGRKMMLDDFTTVQEMLIHGSKVSPDTAKEFSPILNVTMV
ncbi:E3 ubiquitin-protein ligase PDZRN3-B-like [Lytechinus pictus]|uniref:E3 ubiquitin-protein ligase PDZRN3-B-like n=1 Tax=Lytechinus pictus TaxID=7653 RepID=UPI0030B9B294